MSGSLQNFSHSFFSFEIFRRPLNLLSLLCTHTCATALSNNAGSVRLADLSVFAQHGARPQSPPLSQTTSRSPPAFPIAEKMLSVPVPVEAAAETMEVNLSESKPSSSSPSSVSVAATTTSDDACCNSVAQATALAGPATSEEASSAATSTAVEARTATATGGQLETRESLPSAAANDSIGIAPPHARTSPPASSGPGNGADGGSGNNGSGGRSRRSPKIEAAKRLHFASTHGDPDSSTQQQQQQQRPVSPRFLTSTSRHSSPRPPSPRLDRTPSPRRPSPRLDRTPSPRRPQGLATHRSSSTAAAATGITTASGLVSPPAPLSLSMPRQTTLSLQRANLHHPSPTAAAGAFGGLDKHHHHPSGHAYFASPPYGFQRGGGGGGNFSRFPGKALLTSSTARSGAPSTVSAMSSMSRQPSMQLHDVLRARLQEVVAAVVLQVCAHPLVAGHYRCLSLYFLSFFRLF